MPRGVYVRTDEYREKQRKAQPKGPESPRYRHGGVGTQTYKTWAGMLARCRNPRETGYQNYGGRGITVCERWMVFTNFLEDMGERPPDLSLDRINNDGNYEPGNCRWADRATQNANRRNHQPRGSASLRARLNELQVREIRRLYEAGARRADIARWFRIGETTVSHVVNRRTWKHI
jgi:hypothetical protein